MLENEAGGWRK